MNGTSITRLDKIALARGFLKRGGKLVESLAGPVVLLVGRPPNDSLLQIDGKPVELTDAEAKEARDGNQ